MKRPMRFISCFSGMGGFEYGLERSGMECVQQIEIDKQCRRVLAHHWPGVDRESDIAKAKGRRGSAELVCGGFPCQDLSVAGKRAGLAGKRSGLFHEFVRFIGEVNPRWVFVENVPGLLSSWSSPRKPPSRVSVGRRWSRDETSDFAIVVSGLVQLGYSVAWRVLDLQFFHIPQRRERVWIVGHLGDRCAAGKVLFEPSSCAGNPAPSREAQQETSACLGGGAAGRGWSDDLDRAGAFVEGYRTSGNCGVMPQGDKVAAINCASDPNQTIISGSLQSHQRRHGHAMSTQQAAESGQLIAATLRSRQASKGVSAPGRGGEDDYNLVYIPIDLRQASRGGKMTNNRSSGSGGPPGDGIGEAGDPAFTVSERGQLVANVYGGNDTSGPRAAAAVNAGGQRRQDFETENFVVFESTVARNGRGAPDDKVRALRASAEGGRTDCRPMVFNPARTLQADGSVVEQFKADETVDALHGPTGNKEPLVGGVRRLTPKECLRLMGFEDNWLDLDPPLSDSAKYRMAGNSVGIPVVQWIGHRIVKEATGAT